MTDTAGQSAEHDDASVHRRILDALLPLRNSEEIADGQLPPPSYIRRHLVEHAAAAGIIDDRIINPEFLPYADPSRIRAATAAGTVSPSSTSQLASFHAVAYRMRWDAPAANAAALGFANRAIGLPALSPAASDLTSWQPLWASWPIGGDVVGLHAGWVRALAVGELAGRPVVVSGGDDGTVRTWDLASGDLLHVLEGHTAVYAVAVGVLAGRPVVVSGSGDGTIRAWDLGDGQQRNLRVFSGHPGRVLAVALGELAGRPVMVSGGDDGTVLSWDLTVQEQLGQLLNSHAGGAYGVAVGELAGRPVVVSGGGDGAVRTWDLADGQPLGQPLTGHAGGVNAVAVGELAGRPVLVSGGDDGTVRTWDLASGDLLHVLEGHTAVYAVAVGVLHGGPVVVSGGDDGTVRSWDLASGGLLHVLEGHTAVYAVAVGLLAGRPVVVSGSGDGTIRAWDLADGQPLGQPLTGHVGGVNAVAVGELAGRPVLVSGGGDGTVRSWDLASGEPLVQRLTGHAGGVNAVAVGVLAGRPVVVSGGGDGTLLSWDMTLQEQLAESLPIPGRIAGIAATTFGSRCLIAVAGAGLGALEFTREARFGRIDAAAALERAGVDRGAVAASETGQPDRTVALFQLLSLDPPVN